MEPLLLSPGLLGVLALLGAVVLGAVVLLGAVLRQGTVHYVRWRRTRRKRREGE